MGLFSSVAKAVTGAVSSVGSLFGGSSASSSAAGAGAASGNPYLMAAGLGYNVFSDLYNNSQLKKANKQNLANNIRLWNMQNEYNTPKAQMERYKEAGLNPNLIYGQTNTADSITSASVDPKHLSKQQFLADYISLANLGIQKDLSSAQVRNIDNSIDVAQQNLALQKSRLNLDRERLALDKDMANSGLLGQYIGRENSGQLNRYIGEQITNWLRSQGANI